ncbi:hypothetical protein [Chryseobacterium ginsenosidimutans]|uniref:hypothetical protein n=1 Tax=Chryseobacterium ginsenosidimutans TaxID=687846 RepID=UPI0031D5C340
MKEEFEICFKSAGGLFDPQSKEVKKLVEFSNNTIEHIKSIYTKMPPIYFNLINNNSLNATAAIFNNNYLIGVNIGTFDIIRDLFLKNLSCKSNALFKCTKLSLVNTKNGLEYDHSFDPDSIMFDLNYSKLLSQQTTLVGKFVIYHEICHILRGHVDFIKIKHNLQIHEVNTIIDTKIINTLQTLEMDADSFATNRCLNDFFQNQSIDFRNGIYKDLKTFIYYFSYSIYCFFRIFGFYELNISCVKSYSHPPPAIRISMILDNIATILIEKNIKNKDEIIATSMQATRDAENDLSKITYFNNEFFRVQEVYANPELTNYLFQIVNNWKNIKGELEKYTFSELPN